MSQCLSAPTIETLRGLIQQLRDPQKGCSWDRKQTFSSLTPYTLEEIYEVFDAIARQDGDALCDELGDLLYHILFYAQLAQEAQWFTFESICNALQDKLIRRHPHVFADKAEDNTTNRPQTWAAQKTAERISKGQLSALDDIPKQFPALLRADKLQRRCAAVGFDWQAISPVIAKVYEELAEVEAERTASHIDQQKLKEELGDFLFAAVNLVRHLGFNAEETLRAANDKFERRFRQVEQFANEQGSSLNRLNEQELDTLWQRVKQSEKVTIL